MRRIRALLEVTTTMQERDLSEGPPIGPGLGSLTVTGLPGTSKWVIPPEDPRLVIHAVFRDAEGQVITWVRTIGKRFHPLVCNPLAPHGRMSMHVTPSVRATH